MPSNIEIKARVTDGARLRELVEALSDGPGELLEQEDVFFCVPSGRLKLRILGLDRGELILYHRADTAGPKTSDYQIAPTSAPETLRPILAQALPTMAVVKKRRWLFHIGQTRIHLDQVEDLGDFIELEVVLRSKQSSGEGTAIAQNLMRRLEIDEDQLIDKAYVDLLMARDG